MLVQVFRGDGKVLDGPDDLAAGRDGCEQTDVGQVVGLVGEADAVKKRIPDGGDLLVAGLAGIGRCDGSPMRQGRAARVWCIGAPLDWRGIRVGVARRIRGSVPGLTMRSMAVAAIWSSGTLTELRGVGRRADSGVSL